MEPEGEGVGAGVLPCVSPRRGGAHRRPRAAQQQQQEQGSLAAAAAAEARAPQQQVDDDEELDLITWFFSGPPHPSETDYTSFHLLSFRQKVRAG